MRAGTQSCSCSPIEVKESAIINSQIICPRSNNSKWLGFIQDILSVLSSTNDKRIVNLSCVVTVIVADTDFNTSKTIVRKFESVEADITDLTSNGSIPSIFPTGQAVEVGSDGRVTVEWVSLIIDVVADGLAWVLPWDHIVEDSESITTAGVGMVVPEFTDTLILWAHVCAGMWTDCVDLKIVPVAITVRTSAAILNEVIVWVCDPVAGWSLICVEQ